ncbi:MAG: O-antigen ligase family protein [Aquabacterium sp.]|nr:O-antigen ligase family protein [Ferruginibacter sp.]
MEENLIHINPLVQKSFNRGSFKKKLIAGKLNHPLILFIVFLFSLGVSVAVGFFGLKAAILITLAIIGLPAIYATIAYPKAGIILSLILSYFLLFAEKFTDFPVGTIMDGMLALLIFGFFLKQKHRRDWKIFNNPISIMIFIWIGYNILEIANPLAESRLAWVYTVRTVAVVMLMHFIFLYHIRSVDFIKLIFKIWIGLSLIAALYGLNQELFGFFPFEQKWLDDNPTAVSLYFIGGVWRKFSIFSDPVTFSYNMVISAILCISLTTGPVKKWKKFWLFLIAFTCIFSMLFSGTRGAYALVPIALAMFLILTMNKKVLVLGILAGVFMAGLVLMPTSNIYIMRFQSAFSPEYDASFNVRQTNQKMIQPYIITHPIGGGLGATGTWGQRFSPHSFLANFPPDSGYVRVAVELGWAGLLLFCTMMFIFLAVAINNYFKIRDPALKSYGLALVTIVFALHIGNFPQEALVQYPTNIIFSLVLALINIIYTLDKEKFSASVPTTKYKA